MLVEGEDRERRASCLWVKNSRLFSLDWAPVRQVLDKQPQLTNVTFREDRRIRWVEKRGKSGGSDVAKGCKSITADLSEDPTLRLYNGSLKAKAIGRNDGVTHSPLARLKDEKLKIGDFSKQ